MPPLLRFLPRCIQALVWIGVSFVPSGSPAEEGLRPAALKNRIVVFGTEKQGDGTYRSRIVSLAPLGGDLRLEATFPQGIQSGRVAPDGGALAFNTLSGSDSAVHPELWLMASGAEPRLLGQPGDLCGWRPDGGAVLCRRAVDADQTRFDCVEVDVASGAESVLGLPKDLVAQGWSGEGRSLLAFDPNGGRFFDDPQRGRYPLRRLVLWNLETKSRAAITAEDHDCIWPVASPDGKRLAYYLRRHDGGPQEFLAIADADGRNAIEVISLMERSGDDVIRPTGFPCWSPDGAEIAWLRTIRNKSSGRTTWEILVVVIAGRSTRHIPLDEETGIGAIDWGR